MMTTSVAPRIRVEIANGIRKGEKFITELSGCERVRDFVSMKLCKNEYLRGKEVKVYLDEYELLGDTSVDVLGHEDKIFVVVCDDEGDEMEEEEEVDDGFARVRAELEKREEEKKKEKKKKKKKKKKTTLNMKKETNNRGTRIVNQQHERKQKKHNLEHSLRMAPTMVTMKKVQKKMATVPSKKDERPRLAAQVVYASSSEEDDDDGDSHGLEELSSDEDGGDPEFFVRNLGVQKSSRSLRKNGTPNSKEKIAELPKKKKWQSRLLRNAEKPDWMCRGAGLKWSCTEKKAPGKPVCEKHSRMPKWSKAPVAPPPPPAKKAGKTLEKLENARKAAASSALTCEKCGKVCKGQGPLTMHVRSCKGSDSSIAASPAADETKKGGQPPLLRGKRVPIKLLRKCARNGGVKSILAELVVNYRIGARSNVPVTAMVPEKLQEPTPPPPKAPTIKKYKSNDGKPDWMCRANGGTWSCNEAKLPGDTVFCGKHTKKKGVAKRPAEVVPATELPAAKKAKTTVRIAFQTKLCGYCNHEKFQDREDLVAHLKTSHGITEVVVSKLPVDGVTTMPKYDLVVGALGRPPSNVPVTAMVPEKLPKPTPPPPEAPTIQYKSNDGKPDWMCRARGGNWCCNRAKLPGDTHMFCEKHTKKKGVAKRPAEVVPGTEPPAAKKAKTTVRIGSTTRFCGYCTHEKFQNREDMVAHLKTRHGITEVVVSNSPVDGVTTMPRYDPDAAPGILSPSLSPLTLPDSRPPARIAAAKSAPVLFQQAPAMAAAPAETDLTCQKCGKVLRNKAGFVGHVRVCKGANAASNANTPAIPPAAKLQEAVGTVGTRRQRRNEPPSSDFGVASPSVPRKDVAVVSTKRNERSSSLALTVPNNKSSGGIVTAVADSAEIAKLLEVVNTQNARIQQQDIAIKKLADQCLLMSQNIKTGWLPPFDPTAEIKRIKAPGANPGYNPIIQFGRLLWLTGIVSRELSNDAGEQTLSALQNMKFMLTQAGTDLKHLLRVTLHVSDIRVMEKTASAWKEFFIKRNGMKEEDLPVRLTTQAVLKDPKFLVEVHAEAVVPEKKDDMKSAADGAKAALGSA